MIKLACPKCKEESKYVSTELVFTATGTVGLVGTSNGIELQTENPIQMDGELPAAEPVTRYRCGICGKQSDVKDWVLKFYCSECGEPITCPVKFGDNDAFVTAHVCHGGHGEKCYNCWCRLDRSYCPDCRNRSVCAAHAHFTQLDANGGVPNQTVRDGGTRRRLFRERVTREERVERTTEASPEPPSDREGAVPVYYSADRINTG